MNFVEKTPLESGASVNVAPRLAASKNTLTLLIVSVEFRRPCSEIEVNSAANKFSGNHSKIAVKMFFIKAPFSLKS